MHEGKHGILDDLDDMDALFGTEKEKCTNCKPNNPCEKHKHDHDRDRKKKYDCSMIIK